MTRAALLALLAAPAAADIAPPAAPPWSCSMAHLCEGGECHPPGEPRTDLFEPGPNPGTVAVAGAVVPFFATRTQAEASLAAAPPSPFTSYVFVRDAYDPADAIGLSMIWLDRRGGAARLSDISAPFICTGP